MEIIYTIEAMRLYAKRMAKEDKTIGFVPTMGFLHDGHLSLIKRAKAGHDEVVVSVFVNPLQFGKNEDFYDYPKDIERDASLAERAGATVMFIPNEKEMYTEGFCTLVEVNKLTDNLCGKTRPGHFVGVTTVVTKLFNIIRPHSAYFGEKDAQQLTVVKRMVADLNFDIEVVACPTVREKDNLAMSSRNTLLNQDARSQATCISESLFAAKSMIDNGERETAVIISMIREKLETQPLCQVEYIDIVDVDTLKRVDIICGKTMIAIAARFASTRLIDNIIVDVC